MSSHNTDKSPVFILGNGRSGTTMLGEMMTKSGYGKSFEGHFVLKALHSFGDEPLSAEQISDLIALITSFESSQFFKLALHQSDYHGQGSVRAIDIVRDALQFIARKSAREVWVEKTPFYIHELPFLLQQFPEAKFIWMIRDGRDVAYSVLQKSWGANNIYYAAKQWSEANMRHAKLSHERLLKVKYEALLSHPKESLSEIFRFIDYEKASEAIESLASEVKQSRAMQWKKNLSETQIHTFEAIAYDALLHFGYEPMHARAPTIGVFSKFAYFLDNHLKLTKHLLNENLIKPLKLKFGLIKPFDEKH